MGDLYALDIDDDTFDVVHANQVLQHLADPVGALREMKRVCKPGGLVAARDGDDGGFRWYPDEPIRDAIAAGAARIEWTVLPMQYEHLSPLASLVRPRQKGVDEGEEGGDRRAPTSQPPAASSIRDPVGTERDWYRLARRT